MILKPDQMPLPVCDFEKLILINNTNLKKKNITYLFGLTNNSKFVILNNVVEPRSLKFLGFCSWFMFLQEEND